MYILSTILIMFVLPVILIVFNVYRGRTPGGLAVLVGKWFVFWGVGVRLFTAGVSQIFRPEFTAGTILQGAGSEGLHIVQELGFANLALGVLGLGSYFAPTWTVPGAVAGGIFFALAGIRHGLTAQRGLLENVALVSDLVMALILLGYVLARTRMAARGT